MQVDILLSIFLQVYHFLFNDVACNYWIHLCWECVSQMCARLYWPLLHLPWLDPHVRNTFHLWDVLHLLSYKLFDQGLPVLYQQEPTSYDIWCFAVLRLGGDTALRLCLPWLPDVTTLDVACADHGGHTPPLQTVDGRRVSCTWYLQSCNGMHFYDYLLLFFCSVSMLWLAALTLGDTVTHPTPWRTTFQ